MTNYDEVRTKWQPAPGSRLAAALEKAEAALAQWRTTCDRVTAAQARRAAVQVELDAVGLDSDMEAAAAAVGLAQALDLAIMRGKLEQSRVRVPKDAANVEVETIVEGLTWADRPVNEAERRWGVASDAYRDARQERARVHMLYLATPEGAPA